MSMFAEMKMGKYKQYTKPLDFNINEVDETNGDVNSYKVDLDDLFETTSEVKWSKKGELQIQKCAFKVFLQKTEGKKKVSKKGGIIIAEREYDLSSHANKGDIMVNIQFAKSKNATKYTDIKMNVNINIFDPFKNKNQT